MLLVIAKPNTNFKKHPQIQKEDIIKYSDYLLSKKLSLSVILEKSDKPYYLVPSLRMFIFINFIRNENGFTVL